MIHETSEEASKRLFPNKDSFGATARNGFVQGSKWQKERSISKEAYEDSLNMQRCSNAGYESKINELKSEIKLMYSEEDMIKFSSWILLQDITSRGEGNYVNTDGKIVTVKDLFEQFKKK
jgi:hypothetical protein